MPRLKQNYRKYEKEFVRNLAYCGRSHGDMMPKEKLEDYLEKGLIKPAMYRKYGKQYLAYELTDRGKRIFQDAKLIDRTYKSNSIYHDIKLEEILNRNGIARWDTEHIQHMQIDSRLTKLLQDGNVAEYNFWKDMLDNKLMSACDAIVVYDDGTIEAIEITTKHYTEAMRQAKIAYCKFMGYPAPTFVRAGAPYGKI